MKAEKNHERRTTILPIRLRPSERRVVEQLAEQAHDYPSSWLRRLVLNHIEAVRKEALA